MSRLARISLYTVLVCALLLFWNQRGLAQDPPIPADTEVITTPSGLKYSVLKKGEGPVDHPAMGEKVLVHYTGWLTSGTIFDSSRKRGEPIEFRLGEVIEGWNEGLQLMSPGDRFKLTIPPELGYGEEDKGQIPANSTLIFEVELLKVTHAPLFIALDSTQAQTTASGLKYQVLQEGQERLAAKEDIVELIYGIWTSEGKLIDCSALGQNIIGPLQGMSLPVLQEAPLLMKVGTKLLLEVPPALGFGNLPNSPVAPDASTIWQLELVRLIETPRLELPNAEELTTTESGLQYKMLTVGTGKSPKMYESVTCHYSGWLTDGTLFDSSVTRAQPAQFMLGRVIQGWNEGLQLMKEGGSAIFVIPASLGYGKRGQGSIPPDATLVFRIELIRVGKE